VGFEAIDDEKRKDGTVSRLATFIVEDGAGRAYRPAFLNGRAPASATPARSPRPERFFGDAAEAASQRTWFTSAAGL
jgi:hypothetical protein